MSETNHEKRKTELGTQKLSIDQISGASSSKISLTKFQMTLIVRPAIVLDIVGCLGTSRVYAGEFLG